MTRTWFVSLVVALAVAAAAAKPPGRERGLTEELKERLARIQLLGGKLNRISLPPIDGEEDKPEYSTRVVAHERESLAEKMAAILPLLGGFPGEHRLALEAVEWTDSCVDTLRLVRDLNGLRSVSVACWKRPPQAEASIRRTLPQLPPDKISVATLGDGPRPRGIPLGGDETQRLRVGRYNHAVEAYRIREMLFNAGQQEATRGFVTVAEEGAYAAALDLCETAEERVAVLERWLDAANESEAIALERVNAGLRTATAEGLLAARFHRLDIQIRLQEAYDATGLRPGRGKLLAALQAAQPQATGLGDVRLLAAELRPTGVLHLVALVADDRERAALVTWANDALLLAVGRGYLRPDHPLERFELTGVRVGYRALDELHAIETLLPAAVRVGRYDPDAGVIALSGVVPSPAARDALVRELGRVAAVRRVEADGVLVRSATPPTVDPGRLRTDALDALGRNDPAGLLRAADAWVQADPAAVEAWHLRAAAHLLLGRRSAAVGDVRVAAGLGVRPPLPERFQGPARIALSDLIEAGARAACVR